MFFVIVQQRYQLGSAYSEEYYSDIIFMIYC